MEKVRGIDRSTPSTLEGHAGVGILERVSHDEEAADRRQPETAPYPDDNEDQGQQRPEKYAA